MLMRVADELRLDAIYPELAGARALVTGVSRAAGVDMARALAEHRTRLAVAVVEPSEEIDALTAHLAETASELAVLDGAASTMSEAAAVAFAQGPAQLAFGGLDLVVNIIPASASDLTRAAERGDVEDFVAATLLPATVATRVYANRMRLTLTEGLVLNVLVAPAAHSGREAALLGVLRATLAAMTRTQAQKWAEQGLRINAVAPVAAGEEGGFVLGGEADVAALTLYLASRKGRGLSGHVFDASTGRG
ncbi:MAG: SDR family oxidoreductase [Hyphomicrobiaceae bacterium]|nr:SDR family oxidoreductase [Hyphomicrobiaceae bacterium]